MFVDVIPSEHSIGSDPLTYSLPDDLQGILVPGCLVEIPVKNTTEYGVVVGYRQFAPEYREIRNIERIITKEEVLAPYQIAVIQSIAKKYLIPIHRALGFFLSRAVLRRLEKKEFSQLDHPRDPTTVPETIRELIHIRDGIVTSEILRPYIQPGTAILCPDDFTLYRLEKELGSPEDIIYLPNEMTDTRRAQAWIDTRNGKYPILVGNRKILYYNLSRYNRIIYLEDAFGREYFHYPIRIEYIDILDMIAKFSEHSISIITSIPRLTTLTRFRHFSHE